MSSSHATHHHHRLRHRKPSSVQSSEHVATRRRQQHCHLPRPMLILPGVGASGRHRPAKRAGCRTDHCPYPLGQAVPRHLPWHAASLKKAMKTANIPTERVRGEVVRFPERPGLRSRTWAEPAPIRRPSPLSRTSPMKRRSISFTASTSFQRSSIIATERITHAVTVRVEENVYATQFHRRRARTWDLMLRSFAGLPLCPSTALIFCSLPLVIELKYRPRHCMPVPARRLRG